MVHKYLFTYNGTGVPTQTHHTHGGEVSLALGFTFGSPQKPETWCVFTVLQRILKILGLCSYFRPIAWKASFLLLFCADLNY